MNRQLIEANLAFLERATLQGAEVRAFADVVNALQAERQNLLMLEAAPPPPAPEQYNGAGQAEPAPLPADYAETAQ